MSDYVVSCKSCRTTFYVMPVDDTAFSVGHCCFCGSRKVVDVSDDVSFERPTFTVLEGGKAKPPVERPGVSSDTKEGED